MSIFTAHNIGSAPEDSKSTLTQIVNSYGFLPNLAAVLAESPVALNAYLTLFQNFSESSLSDLERNIVLTAVSRENECTYCVAAHSTLALSQNVPAPMVEAIRNNIPIDEPKVEALRKFTQKLVSRRGWVDDSEVNSFLSAGYTKAQVLEVLVGVTVKTLSNYANHITHTPLDPAFASQQWEAEAK